MPVERDSSDFGLLVPGRMPDGVIEIGFSLKRAARGRDYASQACGRPVQLAFDASPLDEIVASHDPDNLAARNVLLKCGFVERAWRGWYAALGPFLSISRNGRHEPGSPRRSHS
jgi:hypothetical protein